MLRSVLVGLLVVSAAASCKGGGEAPAVQPGVAAGAVLELEGAVSAVRGSETRALAAGDAVSADDVIQTGADGHVVIGLAHNNARWELGANKQERVSGSLAWSLARQAQPAKAVDESTTAAGRHAEKSGADTGATSASAEPADTETAAAPAAQPAPAEPAATELARDRAPQREERSEPRSQRKLEISGKGASSGASRGASGASPPPPPPPVATPKARMPADLARDDDSVGGAVERKASPTPGGGAPAKPEVDSARPADTSAVTAELKVVLARERAAMRACLEAAAPRLAVKLTVTRGKATVTITDPAASAAVRSCLATIARRMTFTSIDASVAATLQLTR